MTGLGWGHPTWISPGNIWWRETAAKEPGKLIFWICPLPGTGPARNAERNNVDGLTEATACVEDRKDTEHISQNLHLISGLMLLFESILANTCPVPYEFLQSSVAASAELQISFQYLHRILSCLSSSHNHEVNEATFLQSYKTIDSGCSNPVFLKGNKKKTLALRKTPAVVCHLFSFMSEASKRQWSW